MQPYKHKDYSDPKYFGDNPHSRTCPYCKEKLSSTPLKDSWHIDDNQIIEIHEQTKVCYKEIHNLEDCYLDLRLDMKSVEVWIDYCRVCGWWRLIKDVCISAEEWQMWDIFFGCVGALKELSLEDASTPIDEVRNFIVRNYERRFSVNPKLFEEVVSSVFKSVGYHTYTTGYTHDGGIDVVLNNDENALIGVQVKRYKHKIKVEQIRSFAGALILGGYTKGIFVTRSEYQSGAIEAAKNYTLKTLPIELIDARQFYDALKIAQRKSFDLSELYHFVEKRGIPDLSDYGWDTPRNSL